jgi:glycerol-3-phosphate dehydrogenase
MPVEPAELPQVEGVDDASRERLAARYGYAAKDVLELAAGSPELARRISPELPDLVAEATFAVRREQARSVADVLLRRTRVGILDSPRLVSEGDGGTEAVARAMAGEHGWDERRVAAELEGWRAVAQLEGLVPAGASAASEAPARQEPAREAERA